ncbi:MAG: hypothetical protein ACREAC_25440 [Blastocatellia bacterium]
MPNLANCGIDAVRGIDKDVRTPDSFDDLFACHQVATSFDQQEQYFQWNALERDYPAGASQLISTAIEFEIVKSENLSRHGGPLGCFLAIVLALAWPS